MMCRPSRAKFVTKWAPTQRWVRHPWSRMYIRLTSAHRLRRWAIRRRGKRSWTRWTSEWIGSNVLSTRPSIYCIERSLTTSARHSLARRSNVDGAAIGCEHRQSLSLAHGIQARGLLLLWRGCPTSNRFWSTYAYGGASRWSAKRHLFQRGKHALPQK